MRSALLLPSCSAAILSFCGSVSEAADWPQWRGPDRDGKSPDVGLLKRWPEGGPRQLWKATGIGRGFSSIAVAGGGVYTTGIIEGNLAVTAFDMNGGRAWQTVHGPGWTGNTPGSRSTPTIDGDKLYILSGHGLVGCYDAGTGAMKWTADMVGTFGGKVQTWAYSESVLIYDNLAVVTPGGRNCIVALNKATGERVWTSSGLVSNVGYSSCIAFTFQGVPLIVNMVKKAMVCIDPANGRLLWQNTRATGDSPGVIPTAAYSDGHVFGAIGYKNGGACVRLSVSGGRVSARQAWETVDMICHHGGYVIVDGYIYGNHDRGWSCLDLKTGEVKWNAPGVGKGSICYGDGMLYTFGERGGRMGLVPATPTGFSMAGEFRVRGRGPSWAHPVVVGGRLYLRYDDNLYVFDVRGPRYRSSAVEKPKPRPQPKPTPRTTRRTKVEDPEEKRAQNLLKIARDALKRGQKSAGKTFLEMIAKNYPDTEAAQEARRLLERAE